MANITIKGKGTSEGLGRPAARHDPFERLIRDVLRWDPYAELFRRGTLGAIDPFASWLAEPGGGERRFLPDIEVKETKDAYLVHADLPGVKDDDVSVQIEKNRLTIHGKREHDRTEEGEQYHTYERSYGEFARSFELPDDVRAEDIKAKLEGGVLTVSLPKTGEVKARRIPLEGSRVDEPPKSASMKSTDKDKKVA